MTPAIVETLDFQPWEIWIARSRLRNLVLRTPLLFSHSLSSRTGCQIYLKMECWQLCGCFKVRGAINMVSALTDDERKRGLVTCSSGNHGIALAYAASLFNYPPVKVFLPITADLSKVEKLRVLGAETILQGVDFLETLGEALRYAKENEATYVHSHSHRLVIGGQGTIGIEIMEDLPDVEVVIVPVGGGGLISGVGTAVKTFCPKVKIIGVEAAAAPGAYLSFQDGRCHESVDIRPSVANGLLGTLTPLTWEICRHLVDKIELVEENEIIHAMRVFQEDEQLMIEGAAAVGLAAILKGAIKAEGKKVVLILTGRNINAQEYNKLINQVPR